ncbi:MAG: penicillin-binding protein 1C [Bacteroidetes bacterium]|nr:penicillin-binding protein 1C [Bacteroidota bacterium]
MILAKTLFSRSQKIRILRFSFRYLWYLPLVLFFFIFLFCQPRKLFREPASTLMLDRNGILLGAKISADQQWRFPVSEKLPVKFRQAIVQAEDQWFYLHPGINPVSLIRAAYLDIKYRKIISGGSTLSMQVIRLSRKGKNRTILEKLVEMMLAVRLEFTFTKEKIIRLYASYAPFGGNVVGIEAASWRYFGVTPDHLSWAEAVTLAVLPNNPSLIYPGKNQQILLKKRNLLLNRLYIKGIIDRTTLELSLSETLPGKPYLLPQKAPHLLERSVHEGFVGRKVVSTLDVQLQDKVNEILLLHYPELKANEIYNAAALVLDVNSGNVLAYAGNIPLIGSREHGYDVDIITSPRSTGSILKPFLYASMLNEGLLLPTSLVPDIPMQIGSFIPENYNQTYDGAVPAKRALSRSLNIPAVKMLQTFTYDQFYLQLKKIGITTLTKPADHYGLSIILGGAEANLWDLAGIYASMARTLNHYSASPGYYDRSDFHPPIYVKKDEKEKGLYHDKTSWLDAASIWLTFEAMVEVSRPDEEQQWQMFSSSGRIAWKTGTSFGNRDAWSIGVTPGYVVAVWVGNATGEGRPGLTGIGTAAPVLFDIFKVLQPTCWFTRPVDEMTEIPVCRFSGYRASSICEYPDKVWVQKKGLKTDVCPFHVLIHLDKTGTWQVNSDCESPDNMLHKSWFVLPPIQEWFFRNKNPFYKTLPPFRPDCRSAEVHNMDMIYPKNNSRLYIPVDLNGIPGSVVFKLAHRNPATTVYWHLDESFVGTTTQYHQLALSPLKGIHRLTLIDSNGETLVIRFEILRRN